MNQELVDKAISLLKTGTAIITFYKLDGTERRMVCTLNWKQIPDEHKPHTGTSKKIAEHIISVFDLEKNGWRSITKELITKVEEG